jgi:KaiC/GvpD/RAD55 family RecA-like ATPase
LAEKHKGDGLPLPPSAITTESPISIAKFLAVEGSTLLVKGYAGAGKTTLALQLLAQLSKGSKGVYISSRVSERKVAQQLPWVEGIRSKEKKNEFIDIRLGTAESVLAETLRIIGRKSRDARIKAIVLDTWDGLAKEMEEKEKLKAEKTLVALADSSRTRMIFVSEEPGKTTMDYLVDGIIELVRNEEYGRIFREIEIQKLRGTLISQHKYLYTLFGGVFRHFEPYSPAACDEGKWFKPIEDHDDAFSFGTAAMDQVFGGLGKGNTTLFEYGGDVPYSALRLVEIPAIVNALNLGHGVVVVPLPGAGVESLAAVIRDGTSEEAIRERLAIVAQGDPNAFKPPFYGISPKNPKEGTQYVSDLIAGVRRRSKREGVLVMESVSQVEGAFASSLDLLAEQISTWISNIQTTRVDTITFFMPAESLLRTRLIGMSRGHARLFVRDRSVVLMGDKPSTEAMVLEHSRENPILPALTSIV